MQSLYDVAAPAKLNLFLHIVGRRADGYHLIESVFMLVDWCDTLHFEVRADGQISRQDLSWALPADDLATRAARALQQATQCRQGVHIGLHKSIPAEAGMGGGSSDAASTLLALNRLWRLHLPLEELLKIGLTLGADVPFFLHGRNAWVQGVGEKLQPITLPVARFAVVKPKQGLSTQAIFSSPELQRNTKPAILAGFAADTYGFGRNDLQAVAQTLCPGISQALAWLLSQGLEGRMTGSGSAVFAHTAQDLCLSAAPQGMQARLCSSLDVHPLYGWAGADGVSVGSV